MLPTSHEVFLDYSSTTKLLVEPSGSHPEMREPGFEPGSPRVCLFNFLRFRRRQLKNRLPVLKRRLIVKEPWFLTLATRYTNHCTTHA